jgi:hypothetical protein
MRLLEPFHPQKLDANHPLIVEDLIEISQSGHQVALNSIVLMLDDLILNGLESRYAKRYLYD